MVAFQFTGSTTKGDCSYAKSFSSLYSLIFDTCNISEELEIKIASVITNNKSLHLLALANINLSENILPAIARLPNL